MIPSWYSKPNSQEHQLLVHTQKHPKSDLVKYLISYYFKFLYYEASVYGFLVENQNKKPDLLSQIFYLLKETS